MKFTNRQKLLFDRLVQLGELAASDSLPSKILEINGFGSFFRGKPNPKDADLFIRFERRKPKTEFRKFRKLIKGLFDVDDAQESYDTPKEAMIGLAKLGDKLFAKVTDRERRLFLEWIEGISWHQLYPRSIVRQFLVESSEFYSERMIKRLLPNLNVAIWVDSEDEGRKPSGLRCGFSVSIWTPDQVDLATNVTEVLSEDCVRRNLAFEIDYFAVQHPLFKAAVDLIECEIKILLDLPTLSQEPSDIKWFQKVLASNPKFNKLKKKLFAARESVEKLDAEYNQGECSRNKVRLELEQALTIADQKRSEIKKLYQRYDGLEKIRAKAIVFKVGKSKTDLDIREYVSKELLRSGIKVQKQAMRQLLKSLGFLV